MNISNSYVSYANRSLSAQTRPQEPSPEQDREQLSAALQSTGVDEATRADILTQIDETIATLESKTSAMTVSRDVIRSTIDRVLEVNGIDKAEVGDAIRSGAPARSGGASGSGRLGGPPPRQDESESSTLESILLSSGLDESSTNELISQIVDSIQDLTASQDSDVSVDDLQAALDSVLEDNGVDTKAFEHTFSDEFNAVGLFLDLLA